MLFEGCGDVMEKRVKSPTSLSIRRRNSVYIVMYLDKFLAYFP
jgi:hypothetical protein